MQPWQELINRHSPLILPACPDPLTALLAVRAGYPAIQIGMFAAAAWHRALPDLGLVHSGEAVKWVREVLRFCPVPVLVDADNGHGGPEHVARTVVLYEQAGASAIFLEDQASPKRCGHLKGKKIVPLDEMAHKLDVARRHLSPRTFLLARTDAYESEGLAGVQRRARTYLSTGADGLYFEGVNDLDDIETLGIEFREHPLALSILEGKEELPWLTPQEWYSLGFAMLLYPTSILFRALLASRQGLEDLIHGKPTPPGAGLSLADFEDLVGLAGWDRLMRGD